jgi:hypothetical protein
MFVLGLDPSLTGFGWCIHNSDVVGKNRVFARGKWVTSPKTIFVERYVVLRQKVQDLLDQYLLIDAVGVESPPFGELWSEGLYGLFLMVNEAIWSRRRDVVYFDPVTLKMLVKEDPKIRKGKMFKSDMIDAARADTGIVKWNADEADAYHIGRYSARFWKLMRGEIEAEDLTPSECRAFIRIHTFKRGKRKGQTIKTGAVFRENQRYFRFSSLEK